MLLFKEKIYKRNTCVCYRYTSPPSLPQRYTISHINESILLRIYPIRMSCLYKCIYIWNAGNVPSPKWIETCRFEFEYQEIYVSQIRFFSFSCVLSIHGLPCLLGSMTKDEENCFGFQGLVCKITIFRRNYSLCIALF